MRSAIWFCKSPALRPFFSIMLFKRWISALRSVIVLSRSAIILARFSRVYYWSIFCWFSAFISLSFSTIISFNLSISLLNSARQRSSASYAFAISYSRAVLTVVYNLVCHSFTSSFFSASDWAFKASSESSFSVSKALYFLLDSCTWAAISFAWAFLRASTASLFA